VLLIVNIVSHNPAQSSSDNMCSRQSPYLGCCLAKRRGEVRVATELVS